MTNMDGSGRSTATKTDQDAIYHEVSPTIILLLRMFNFLVLVMAVISFIICLVQGSDNQSYYLLASNTIISSSVGIVVNWWYRKGDLDPDKYWYIFLVGLIITFQCVTTDIFVFRDLPPTAPSPTPFRTTPRHNITATYNWITIQTAATVPHN